MPPFRIASNNNGERFGIVASSIPDLRRQAKRKFNFRSPANRLVVQLEDRTIVDDEDYFKCLDDNTCLIVSEPGASLDEVDGAPATKYESDSMCSNPRKKDDTDLTRLAVKLHDNIRNIVTFTNQQLEAIANADLAELRGRLQYTNDEVDSLQEACHTHLVEREKTTEAINLLKMFEEDKGVAEPVQRKKPRLGA